VPPMMFTAASVPHEECCRSYHSGRRARLPCDQCSARVTGLQQPMNRLLFPTRYRHRPASPAFRKLMAGASPILSTDRIEVSAKLMGGIPVAIDPKTKRLVRSFCVVRRCIFRHNVAAPCQPRPTAWVTGPGCRPSPHGADLYGGGQCARGRSLRSFGVAPVGLIHLYGRSFPGRWPGLA
jgi:hypothetical protein